MKAKTIKTTIRNKVNDWLSTVPEENGLRELLASNVIVTGGCITSMLLQESVNDYDVYFRTKAAALAAANHYVARFKLNPPTKFASGQKDVDIYVEETEDSVKVVIKSAGIVAEATEGEEAPGYQYFESVPDEIGEEYVSQVMKNVTQADEITTDPKKTDPDRPRYRPVFMSSNAITLSDSVQLVLRFTGEPEKIHTYFDFIHCTSYWTSWSDTLVLPAAALEAIITKELRYVGSKYPLCSIIRIRKFVTRGWSINAGQILKMCMQLQSFDLRNISVLQDQLTGVDTAYFSQILDRLQEKQDEEALAGNPGAPIDTSYLMTIIDRLF